MRIRIDLRAAHLARDAAGEILELEERDLAAAVLEDALAIALDHAAHLHDGPVFARRERRDRHGLDLREGAGALEVALERMPRDVEAERLLLAHEHLAAIPRLGLRVVAGGGRRLLGAGVEEPEQVRLPALAIA